MLNKKIIEIKVSSVFTDIYLISLVWIINNVIDFFRIIILILSCFDDFDSRSNI